MSDAPPTEAPRMHRRVPWRELDKMRLAARDCVNSPGRCPDYPRCAVLLSMIAEIGRARSAERIEAPAKVTA